MDTTTRRPAELARATPARTAGQVWLDQALRRVAPISPWAMRLLSLSPEAEGSDLTLRDLIASDPALLGRVIGTANSRVFNPMGHEVTQVSHAIRRLGTREVWRIAAVLALGASSRIRPELRGAKRALWSHSFMVAHAARVLAEAAGRPGSDPDKVYLAGLLHDIGLMVLLSVEPERCATMLLRVADPAVGFTADAEAPVGLPPHARIGAAVCQQWGLPADLVRLVDAHGRTHPLDQPESDRGAAAALELGHQLAERLADYPDLHKHPSRDDAPLLRTFLRLPEAALERVRTAVREAVPRIAEVAAAA